MVNLAALAELPVVEAFVCRALTEAGIWGFRGQTDGLAHAHFVECTGERVSVRGEIWEVTEQARTWFWLVIESTGAWTLGFGVEGRNAKRVGAVEAITDVEWVHLLDGEAAMREDAPAPIAARYRDA